jgi:hypothetical protein
MESRRIEPINLGVIERRDPGAPQEVPAEKSTESLQFARLLQSLHRQNKDASDASTTLRELLAEFVTPAVTDPAILSTDRAIAILEELLATIPQLKESEEFQLLACAVVDDEIKQRRRLRARRKDTSA